MPLPEFRLVTERQVRSALAQASPVPNDEWLIQWLPLIENEVERYLGRALVYSDNVVEWFSPSDDQFLLLDRRPVHEIIEVKVDSRGGFGQKTATFDASTILTSGDDYFLALDGRDRTQGSSDTGLLWRVNKTWGYTRSFQSGLLASTRTPAQGIVKVTYKGGYKKTNDEATNQIPGIAASAVVQAAGIWFNHLVRPGILEGENVDGYGWHQVLGVNLGDNIFASVRGMLTSLKSYRPGAGGGIA